MTNLNDSADLQRKVGVLVLLPHLKTRQVREAQLHLVLVQEVLGHGALHCLPVLQLEG